MKEGKSLEIQENRLMIYTRDGFTCNYPECNVSGYDNLQLAHKITNTKDRNQKFIIKYWFDNFKELITKKYAEEMILHHHYNIETSCSKHNQFFVIDSKPEEIKILLTRIRKNLIYKAL